MVSSAGEVGLRRRVAEGALGTVVPHGRAAELGVLLLAAGAVTFVHRETRFRVRRHVAEIDAHGPAPDAVAALMALLGCAGTKALAWKLLPASPPKYGPGAFDPGISQGVLSGGHGGLWV